MHIFAPQINGIIRLIDEQLFDFHSLDSNRAGEQHRILVTLSPNSELIS